VGGGRLGTGAGGNAGAIVTFGDSITDGYSTTAGANRAWPAQLAERLQAEPATAGRAVINAVIFGASGRKPGPARSLPPHRRHPSIPALQPGAPS
jgi:hypothetical protein